MNMRKKNIPSFVVVDAETNVPLTVEELHQWGESNTPRAVKYIPRPSRYAAKTTTATAGGVGILSTNFYKQPKKVRFTAKVQCRLPIWKET